MLFLVLKLKRGLAMEDFFMCGFHSNYKALHDFLYPSLVIHFVSLFPQEILICDCSKVH